MSDSDEYSNVILSQTDAAVLCAARGGWLVDMDEGRGALNIVIICILNLTLLS